MFEITADTFNALADKIDTLDLTETEQAVFEQVLARATACESEVEGFAFDKHSSKGFIDTSIGLRGGMAHEFGRASGIVWTDVPAIDQR